jgi:Ulp1 protease family, C-terminal catalytic domain
MGKNCVLRYTDFVKLQYSKQTRLNQVSEHGSINQNFWLNEQVIDILFKLREKRIVKRIKYLDHFQTKIILENRVPKKFLPQSFDFYNVEYIVMSFCLSGHWILFIANLELGALFIIDPKNPAQKNSNISWLINFQKFLDLTNARKPELPWEIQAVPLDMPSQSHDDNDNCGVYIVIFCDVFFGAAKYDSSNPLNCRKLFQLELLKESEDMRNDCMMCGGKIRTKKTAAHCIVCKRFFCSQCNQTEYKFTCFLCKR